MLWWCSCWRCCSAHPPWEPGGHELYEPDPSEQLTYHNGTVLGGDILVRILWYGRFTAAQKAIMSDFIVSLAAAPGDYPAPSVPQWWSSIDRLYLSKAEVAGKKARVILSGEVSDEGARWEEPDAVPAPRAGGRGDARERRRRAGAHGAGRGRGGFCMSRCGMHGSGAKAGTAYVWAGNSAAQCPGQCAWLFQQEEPAVVPPNDDLGMDGLINVASMLAGAVTDPFGDGFYQENTRRRWRPRRRAWGYAAMAPTPGTLASCWWTRRPELATTPTGLTEEVPARVVRPCFVRVCHAGLIEETRGCC
ncbi:hypothetical protein ZWY2020_034644 [Hordeum vulgare]|nr:hypothetical protein ZWY2020_034644 [Hordeum vulgare]